MPEPIQSTGSNLCVYDPSQDVSHAVPPPRTEPSPPPVDSPGVTTLVNKNPPTTSSQCLPEKAALAAATGSLVRASGAVIFAAPTIAAELPAILGFIGSAITVGATAAALGNCEDKAAAEARALR